MTLPDEPNKQNAYRAVKSAINNGSLIRPAVCQRCGVKPKTTSDGRSNIHAHHHDYSKPLEVEWLCAKCHRASTPLPKVMGAPVFGERNGQAKLTAEVAAMIRNSPIGCRRLSRQLGINKMTVQRVRNGTHWSKS